MAWTHLKYSRTRIDRAGANLRQNLETHEDLAVVSNWCSAHGLPLHFIKMLLRRRALQIERNALVPQRQKRIRAIKNKLQRETIRLTQMQDLGGCRAVLSDIAGVNELKRKFTEGEKKNPSGRHILVATDDYIALPKTDGYRSLHYVYKYWSKSNKWSQFNNYLVEVQIRTRLQHAWATAVETVDAVTGQALKSALKTNVGDETWRRFFALMGSEFALREGTALVPNTPTEVNELRTEIVSLAQQLNVINVLEDLTEIIVSLSGDVSKYTVAYLLVLNTTERKTNVYAYEEDDLDRLDYEQLAFETENLSNQNILILRVYVDSVEAIHEAYPSYYLNAREFINALESVLSDAP